MTIAPSKIQKLCREVKSIKKCAATHILSRNIEKLERVQIKFGPSRGKSS